MAGTINISTQFIWREADPIPKRLNSKCYLELTILDGEWFADADFLGQQDPYIQWLYGKDIMKTSVKDDAGKKAEWNETFKLENVREQILNGEEMKLDSFDEDILIHDYIGGAWPIPWQDFCHDTAMKTHQVDLYDKKKKKAGWLKFSTQFVFIELKITKLNLNACDSLWKGVSTAHSNLDPASLTEGMKAQI